MASFNIETNKCERNQKNFSKSNISTSEESKIFYKAERLFDKGKEKVISKTDNKKGETYLISKTLNGENITFSFQKIEGVFGTNPQMTAISIDSSDDYKINFSWGGLAGYSPIEASSIKDSREKEEFKKNCIDFLNNILEKFPQNNT